MTTERYFRIWNARFYEEVMEKALLDNYVTQAHQLSDASPLPNLSWMSYEDRFLFQNEYLMRNLAYRVAGSEMYPATYEAFTDLDFERLEESYELTDGTVKVQYTRDFLHDFQLAHQLLRLTHVVQEYAFQEERTMLQISGMRGGGFTCLPNSNY